MKSKNAIHVAVLGSGSMGESVIRHLIESPLVSGITAYDVHTGHLQEVKQRHGIEVSDNLTSSYFHNTRVQALDIVRRDALATMQLCFAADSSADQKRTVFLDEIASEVLSELFGGTNNV